MKLKPHNRRDLDLFCERLDAIIDMDHCLVRLSGLVPWATFDEAFGKHYRPLGRPAKPTRLLVGLHYLKHMHDLSDEEAVSRWVENPYWQYFCGFEFFQHRAAIDPSSMTRWRKRIGPEGMETVLAAHPSEGPAQPGAPSPAPRRSPTPEPHPCGQAGPALMAGRYADAKQFKRIPL